MQPNPLLNGLQQLPSDLAPKRANPLLEKVQLPGKFFQLPSKGLLYSNGELEAKDGEIQVKPLSAMAEIKIKNADMLLNGKAFEEVIAECSPNIKKPMELYGRDVDAILCFLRYVTYGPYFEVETKHTCENSQLHRHKINLDGIISSMQFLSEEELQQNYIVDLPNGQVVQLQPYRLKTIIDVLTTAKASENKMPSAEELQENLTKQLLNMVHSVDGIEDKSMISDWLKQIPAPYKNLIIGKMEHANEWGPDFTEKVVCPDCGNVYSVEIPVNPISFFSE